jgi:hypothetical protein
MAMTRTVIRAIRWAVALLALGVSGACAAAQPKGEPHTPPRGSAERAAILDAMRAARGAADQVFVAHHFKVQEGWAWVVASPESRDGTQRYELESWLLQRTGKGWAVVAQPCAEVTCDAKAELAKIRERFPSAPAGIFR